MKRDGYFQRCLCSDSLHKFCTTLTGKTCHTLKVERVHIVREFAQPDIKTSGINASRDPEQSTINDAINDTSNQSITSNVAYKKDFIWLVH